MSIYHKHEIVALAPVPCPGCRRKVRAVVVHANLPVAHPCGCTVNSSWAEAFDREMKARGRGDAPSDVAGHAERLRTIRLGDALAEFESMILRRAAAVFRADYDDQRRLERQLLIKRAYLASEGANAKEISVLDNARFHPDVYDEADNGRLVMPTGGRCWSPYPFTIGHTELYGAIDAIEDFRRYPETQRHEAARAAFSDRNAAVAGSGTRIREVNALTAQLYVFLLPEIGPIITVRPSETAYLDQHPSEAMSNRLQARTRRRVEIVGTRRPRKPPETFVDDLSVPDDLDSPEAV